MVVSPDGSKVATSDSNYNTLVYVVHEDSLKVLPCCLLLVLLILLQT